MTETKKDTPAGDQSPTRGLRKTLRGHVVSNKMDKTLAVMIERRFRHPVYEKYVSQRTKVYAHDENNEANIGDVVQLMETRRLSKKKRWRLVRILQKAES